MANSNRWWLACAFLIGCSGGAPAGTPGATPGVTPSSWVSAIKPWYCGAEQVAAKETPTDTRAARSRDMALRLVPTEDSFTGLYGLENGGEAYIGTLSRFEPLGERKAKLHWKNDRKQKGEATFAFSPDFTSVTVKWQVGAEAQTGASVLAAADPATCVAAKLIK